MLTQQQKEKTKTNINHERFSYSYGYSSRNISNAYNSLLSENLKGPFG